MYILIYVITMTLFPKAQVNEFTEVKLIIFFILLVCPQRRYAFYYWCYHDPQWIFIRLFESAVIIFLFFTFKIIYHRNSHYSCKTIIVPPTTWCSILIANIFSLISIVLILPVYCLCLLLFEHKASMNLT